MTDTDPELESAYRHCRNIAARHGRSYFLATRLLPAADRPAVHALYAFARVADDIVDVHAGADLTVEQCAAAIDRLERQMLAAFDGTVSATAEHRAVLLALGDTVRRYDLAPQHFRAFLRSMRMDVPGTPEYRSNYRTMAELVDYMHGSAAAIGLLMLPILGTVVPVREAEPTASELGNAFQLTNFIRDIGEDLDRGRIYLPTAEWEVFGVDGDLLRHGRRTGSTEPKVKRAIAHFTAMNRSSYRQAEPGIELLSPRTRPGVRAAYRLYSGILDEIERNDFQVLDRRVVVPRRRRLSIAGPELVRGVAQRIRTR